MNLGICGSLHTIPELGTWYRAVQPRYLPGALATTYTTGIRSRFSAGPAAVPPFEILYLAENHMVALFEVEAQFGSPLKAGGIVPNPAHAWVILNVQVSLKAVVDLTNVPGAQTSLGTTVQELTGDWKGFGLRGPHTKVKHPVGSAPTQDLGSALYSATICEGFRAVSARVPYHEVLAVFPKRLRPGSFVEYTYTDDLGTVQRFRIP
jgi:hypothetical protein